MRRIIAGLRPLWGLLLVVGLAVVVGDLAGLLTVPDSIWWVPSVIGAVGLSAVGLVTAPRAKPHDLQLMSCPVRGEWTSVNTPGQRLPSHGTRALGQWCAVDVLRPSTDATPPLVRWGLRGSAPTDYESFGEPIHAMATGTVVRCRSGAGDHRARNTWPTRLMMLTVEAVLRSLFGPSALLGNHIIVDHGDGTVAAYAHLRRGSATVEVGDRIRVGEVLGRIGNSGSSSEPHLHVQLMDSSRLRVAAGMKLAWHDVILTGELDARLAEAVSEPEKSAIKDMPPMGEVFTTPWMGESPS
ncbi:M23 family metallopeptidase [Nesterenkonia marinintestina]|uniref:M23 family metallopeptidase n=1 Tax=Nesterenkonia marinintestina TaxID=2979865 RepID=UPI0021C06C12|nr:M23 family metallopeptidase [Nesterenkonia sp. GX14115]